MKRLTRVAIFFVFLLLGSFALANPAQASIVDWFQDTFGLNKNLDDTLQGQVDGKEGKVSLPSHIGDFNKGYQSEWFLSLNGVPKNSAAVKAMTEEEKAIVYEMYGRGVIGETQGAIAMLYTPPASGTTYVAQMLQDAHIVPRAQAQGLGFASLDPVLETWKVFRNVAYLFFVVVFLAIGFMIMFRQKIGGQTAVTVQQAIPGIITSLIFVTFSYAIAGFLIDLMYLLMYLMIGLFSPESGTEMISKNFLQIGFDVVTGVNTNGAFASMNEAVKTFADSIDTNAVGDVLGWIGGLTMGLIVSIAILIGVFKLFFELLKIYITIIIAIVVSPIILMTGALPGKSNFVYWIKMVFGNLLAFPLVLFSLILYEMFTSGDLSAGGFMPPFLIGRGSGSVMMTLVGIGIILIIPELIKEMKKALKIDGGPWEAMAMAAFDKVKDARKPTGKLALAGASAGLGATGALAGGIYHSRGSGSFKEGLSRFGKGALVGGGVGAAAPVAIAKAPQLIKTGARLVGTQVGEVAREEVIEPQLHNIRTRTSKILAARNKDADEGQNEAKENIDQNKDKVTKAGNRYRG